MNGHAQCLKRLLELGIDWDPRDEEGRTPLHWAALEGCVECVKALLDAGADVRANAYQARPLYSPTGTGSRQNFSLSLCRGAV